MRKLSVSHLLVVMATTILGAQSVVPPPRPQPDGPSLASILESLKQTLLASGEVKYTWQFTSTRGNNVTSARSKIIDVAVSAPDCRVRLALLKSFGASSATELPRQYFLEAIESVEVLSLQEAWDRRNPRQTNPRQETFSPGYEVVINDNIGELQFADRDVATRAAELLLHASEICRAVPVHLNPAAGNPGLRETLHFIEQKINDEGTVSYESRKLNDPEDSPSRISKRALDAHGDLDGCRLRYSSYETSNDRPSRSNVVISFRRVQKLEVMSVQQIWNRFLEAAGVEVEEQISPTNYVLLVSYAGASSGMEPAAVIYFHDEETADRVAKALNHAAEICRPESKELF